ncbi:MAG: hypothetical protein ACOZBH_01960 [Patescibacteria group bacterium]
MTENKSVAETTPTRGFDFAGLFGDERNDQVNPPTEDEAAIFIKEARQANTRINELEARLEKLIKFVRDYLQNLTQNDSHKEGKGDDVSREITDLRAVLDALKSQLQYQETKYAEGLNQSTQAVVGLHDTLTVKLEAIDAAIAELRAKGEENAQTQRIRTILDEELRKLTVPTPAPPQPDPKAKGGATNGNGVFLYGTMAILASLLLLAAVLWLKGGI